MPRICREAVTFLWSPASSGTVTGGAVPRPAPRLGSAVIHRPDRSGLPSAIRGAGAVMLTLPSARRGTPDVGWFTHCAVSRTDASKAAVTTRAHVAWRIPAVV